MKTFEQTVSDIADKHAEIHRNSTKSVESTITDALTEYADLHDDKALASDLLRVAGDRDGWFRKYLDASEENKRMVQAMKDQAAENHKRTENFNAEEVATGFIHMIQTTSWDKDQMVRILEVWMARGMDELERKLKAMGTSRDDAIAAAKLAHEQHADKARLDWLEAHADELFRNRAEDAKGEWFVMVETVAPSVEKPLGEFKCIDGAGMRQAIDSAMSVPPVAGEGG